MNLPNDEMEFRLNWTSCAATASALKGIAAQALGKAGELYSRRQDSAAEALRSFGLTIEHQAQKASDELQEYIKEDARRTVDFKNKGHRR